MPETKKYLSKIVKGGNTLWLKDAEARQSIQDILDNISSALHWKGNTTTALVDGATTNPIVIDGENYTAVAGDVVAVAGSGSGAQADKEFAFNGTKWQEFGSTGSLGALAFKSSASGSYTPAGTNAASAVTFTDQTDAYFVNGFDTDPVLPSFSEGAFDAGSLPSKEADTFSAGSLPTLGEATTSNFATAGEISEYDEEEETLTFSDATTSAAVTKQGTFSQGTLPSYTEGTFSAGTLPSKAADTFSAGSLPSKTADSFSAGTAPTLATAKAITAVGTGTAAAQTFIGTQATITVE